MLPTLRQLEYLVAIADTGQFVHAARRCGVSQPALSKQVREVEEQLGVVLFERVRPRVIVTPIGEEIIRRARRLLADARELVETARASATPRRGSIRLGVIPTVAPYGLPGLLAKLRVRLPEVSFVIQELQTEVLLERLRAGAIDLGLLARAFDDTGLATRDLVVEPFVLLAPAGHPLGKARAVRSRDIVGADLLLMEDGHCLRDQAIEVCAAAGTPSTKVDAASVSTLVRMVESGLGPTLLPASALQTELRPAQGVVARSFVGSSPPGRTLTLAWRATAPAGAWFAEIGEVLAAHYLSMNAELPEVAGPRPRIRRVTPTRQR
ncbi:MAG: hydrogen peroxide-inducible genes activator [Myxococcales bacterium]|nr:hydrogen peroxide-inducible genes activator [Myxococcales bacterium]